MHRKRSSIQWQLRASMLGVHHIIWYLVFGITIHMVNYDVSIYYQKRRQQSTTCSNKYHCVREIWKSILQIVINSRSSLFDYEVIQCQRCRLVRWMWCLRLKSDLAAWGDPTCEVFLFYIRGDHTCEVFLCYIRGDHTSLFGGWEWPNWHQQWHPATHPPTFALS